MKPADSNLLEALVLSDTAPAATGISVRNEFGWAVRYDDKHMPVARYIVKFLNEGEKRLNEDRLLATFESNGIVAELRSFDESVDDDFSDFIGGAPVETTEGPAFIIAYFDEWGRVFSARSEITRPPACIPAIALICDKDRALEIFPPESRTLSCMAEVNAVCSIAAMHGAAARRARRRGDSRIRHIVADFEACREAEQLHECGVVGVCTCDQESVSMEVANYILEDGLYFVDGSWFNFDRYCKADRGLYYEEFMVRMYMAFRYRGVESNMLIVPRDLEALNIFLDDAVFANFVDFLWMLPTAEKCDKAFCVPSLAKYLRQWLVEAGVGSEQWESLMALNDGNPLRLVRTRHLSDLYYLCPYDYEKCAPYRRLIWGCESALNKYKMLSEILEGHAHEANYREIKELEDDFIGEFLEAAMRISESSTCPSSQTVRESLDASNSHSEPLGLTAKGDKTYSWKSRNAEWALHMDIALSFERIRTPFRFAPLFRVNIFTKTVVVDLQVADINAFSGACYNSRRRRWESDDEETRCDTALTHTKALSVMIAEVVFKEHPQIERVVIAAYPVRDEGNVEQDAERILEGCENDSFAFTVNYTREKFFAFSGSDEILDLALYLDLHEFIDSMPEPPAPCRDGAIFEVECPELYDRVAPVEMLDGKLPRFARHFLFAQRASDLGIGIDAARRYVGVSLADSIVKAADTTERIRLITERKAELHDPELQDACNDLMVALTMGTIDPNDHAAIAQCFVPDNGTLGAVEEAIALFEAEGVDAGVNVLMQMAHTLEQRYGIADTNDTVYRCFDSYASRLAYNRAVHRGLLPDDAGKTVRLAPDGLLFCYIEALRMLEHSFEHTDEAIRIGQRCIELAPASSPGYMQLARIYMLVGDIDLAQEVIERYLTVTVSAEEAGWAYNQLAYAFSRVDRIDEASACYTKAMILSPSIFETAARGLDELVKEYDVYVCSANEVDDVLMDYDIPVAPSPEKLEWLHEAGAAAVDLGYMDVARSAFGTLCQGKPSDVLSMAILSLGD